LLFAIKHLEEQGDLVSANMYNFLTVLGAHAGLVPNFAGAKVLILDAAAPMTRRCG
jgi:hypothetical protein